MSVIRLDCRGLCCPEPLMVLKKAVRDAKSGDIVEIFSDDPVSLRDFPAFCKFMSHDLLNMPDIEHPDFFRIRKK
ncbi:MAG: sulfurtransferase TusA family protein [Succinatimonas sp.]|nr:sulfurtransferase TusA family protein [Succinatimonas sp.]